MTGLGAAAGFSYIDVLDATSSLEISTAGGAAAGSVTIDSGVTTTVAGSFQAPSIVDNGTIIVAAGSALNLLGALSGTGQIDMAAGRTCTFKVRPQRQIQ